MASFPHARRLLEWHKVAQVPERSKRYTQLADGEKGDATMNPRGIPAVAGSLRDIWETKLK